MKQTLLLIFLLCAVLFALAQQISIPRIDKMPNMPAPYLMRDWKKVAVDYDNFVFDTGKVGNYLPITKISTSNGVNYPEIKTIRMDTYVGQNDHGNVAEAINIIPAVVGASLVGVDKTTHLSTNWVSKIKDFYNQKNGQHVYLNNYSTTTGNDWWYEVMPNVFFYQLYALYPNVDADFKTQFITIANRQLNVLYQLGGTVQPWNVPNMNFRAFNLITGLPNSTSVPEPETAGSIAWILHQAYIETNNRKYLQGAEMALDFLQNWTNNPSYEIQLPYGIIAAARMNAETGTNYNIQKMMNWSFSAGQGTLRGWGCIVGNWNGYDVSGLIGEANDKGNDYAFSMNGFQHAAALAPVVKYDKRYARAIGKWILNMANASRLFYTNALQQANYEPAGYAWAKQYDTNSCIPFESMKQTWNGTSPRIMGDAVQGGWAATDLSMYSGSSIGYMAAIINKTNVEGILQIDLNKTDFRGDNSYPRYLYYNPTTNSQQVDVNLPTGNYDVYDVITETVLNTNISGSFVTDIPADNVRLLVIYPTGKTTVFKGRLRIVDGHIIDFHSNYNFSNPLRIKVFSVSDTLTQISNSLNIYCLAENTVTKNPSFQWFQNDVLLETTNSETYSWQAPPSAGVYRLKCKLSENGDTVISDPILVTVVEKLIAAPLISDIKFSRNMPFDLNSVISAHAILNTTEVQYQWNSAAGTLTNHLTALPTWNLPGSQGIFSISLTVNNSAGTSTFTKPVLVKDFFITGELTPLIYYPFNGDSKNYAQNAIHALSVNAVSTTGANGIANSAYYFPTNASYIYTPNEPTLNFQDKIAVSFWVKPAALPNNEQFILSHGSWEERYKISITPEKKVRWTVKTDNSVVDVDADTVLQVGKFDHFTAVYSGYSMELYRNGLLSGFKPLTGKIKTTAKNLTIARKDVGTSEYNFCGTVDEVRIYNEEPSPGIIKLLPLTFKLKSELVDTTNLSFYVYPNPFIHQLTINLPKNESILSVHLFDSLGKQIKLSIIDQTIVSMNNIPKGIFFLKIIGKTENQYFSKIIKK